MLLNLKVTLSLCPCSPWPHLNAGILGTVVLKQGTREKITRGDPRPQEGLKPLKLHVSSSQMCKKGSPDENATLHGLMGVLIHSRVGLHSKG